MVIEMAREGSGGRGLFSWRSMRGVERDTILNARKPHVSIAVMRASSKAEKAAMARCEAHFEKHGPKWAERHYRQAVKNHMAAHGKPADRELKASFRESARTYAADKYQHRCFLIWSASFRTRMTGKIRASRVSGRSFELGE